MLARFLAAALFLALLAAPAEAEVEFCGPSDRACAHLAVPLDHSGTLPGTVKLTIERTLAKNAREPPLFLVAGGPGQSATRALPRAAVREVLGSGVLARRDVVVLDQRGTGESGALSCPTLQAYTGSPLGAAVERCAAGLGPGRAFYTTADSVADLDAVRAALGYDRIALFGTSYGTMVALDYAAAHPDRVDRLVLDSPVGPDGVDPLYHGSFAASPRVLRELCRGACHNITADPVRDLTQLIRRLARKPLRGVTVTPRGRRRRVSLTRFDLFSTLVAGDQRPAIRERFPAAVRSAVTGDVAPILRLARFAGIGEETGVRDFSVGTYTATMCEETALPWGPAIPVDQRLAHAAQVVTAEPPAAFAPFDADTALASDVLRLCERWPASGRARAAVGRMPNVPVLVLSGSQDLRTPTGSARRVAELFPQAQTLVAQGLGHDVTGSDVSGCTSTAVRRFLTGRRVQHGCRRVRLSPRQRDPRSLRAVRPAPRTRGRPGRTLAAVRRTYQDALRSYFDLFADRLLADSAAPGSLRFADGGLRSGRYVLTPNRGLLRGLVYVPGVRVSGRLSSVAILPDGVLRVRGRTAAHGTLRVREGVMSGRLGGRHVRGTLGPDLVDMALDLSLPQSAGASSLAPLTSRR